MFFFPYFRADPDFLDDFIRVLKNGTNYDNYHFQCPPTNPTKYRSQPFEFSLVLMKHINGTPSKPAACNNINDDLKTTKEGDSSVVIPCPPTSENNYAKYANLATFVLGGRKENVVSLFKKAADLLFINLKNETLSQKNWYFSSSGGNSNWIQIRIDPNAQPYHYST